MEIYESIDFFSSYSKNIITLGVFDGVHYGHRKIIKRLNKIAKDNKNMSTLISFYPHPLDVLYPNIKLKYLTIYEERIFLLKKTGIQNLIIHPFNKNIANINFEVFVKNILIDKLNMKYLILGYDNNIGKNKKGTYKELKKISKKYQFGIEKISAVKINAKIISSTAIRKSISLGELSWANKALGYPYIISGKVIQGNQLGSKIGFPTANIQINKKKLLPIKGVYAVKIQRRQKIYKGMLNIGTRPTFNGIDIKVEVHLLNFYKMIYGEILYIFLYKYIRQEKKFNNITQLKIQLEKDKLYIQQFFLKNLCHFF